MIYYVCEMCGKLSSRSRDDAKIYRYLFCKENRYLRDVDLCEDCAQKILDLIDNSREEDQNETDKM